MKETFLLKYKKTPVSQTTLFDAFNRDMNSANPTKDDGGVILFSFTFKFKSTISLILAFVRRCLSATSTSCGCASRLSLYILCTTVTTVFLSFAFGTLCKFFESRHIATLTDKELHIRSLNLKSQKYRFHTPSRISMVESIPRFTRLDEKSVVVVPTLEFMLMCARF